MTVEDIVKACEGMKDGETRVFESPDGSPLVIDSNTLGVALAVYFFRTFYVRISGAKVTVKRSG